MTTTPKFNATESLQHNPGVFHNHGGGSFFQKDKSCVGPKLKHKSILLFCKDLLETKSCQLGAI